MGYWAEVRNTYFESGSEIDRVMEGDVLATISIDAWKTMADEEQGSVVARVLLSKHGDVLVDYHDNVARVDEKAQQAILGAKEQLKAYYFERAAFIEKPTVSEKRSVYFLCETHELEDAIRTFDILAVSEDKTALNQLMNAKIATDEYGFSKENGVHIQTEDYYSTNFDCGFVEYYVSEKPVLSREALELLIQDEEQPALSDQIQAAEKQKDSLGRDDGTPAMEQAR